jgi:hypothetical protein
MVLAVARVVTEWARVRLSHEQSQTFLAIPVDLDPLRGRKPGKEPDARPWLSVEEYDRER